MSSHATKSRFIDSNQATYSYQGCSALPSTGKHADSLGIQILKDSQVVSNVNRKKFHHMDHVTQSEDEDETEESENFNLDLELNSKALSLRKYSKLVSQKKLLEEEVAKDPQTIEHQFDSDDFLEEPNQEIIDELNALYEEDEEVHGELNQADRDLFEKWIKPPSDVTDDKRTLAEIIIERLENHQVAISPTCPKTSSIPEKVVQVYQKLGVLLARYKSGKLPKAFKVLPSLSNWSEIIPIANSDSWTPHSVYQATKLFASSLKPQDAQHFYASVLLPHVRNNIAQQKKLNVYLYDALKKALYKPSAFYKGIILPLCVAGDCSLKEAVIIASVLAKQSIPMLHSAACILKLVELEYSGCVSIFLRTLLDKKYTLPEMVISTLVHHFASFADDSRPCYLLWHQSLLVFVQRYRKAFSANEREAILALCRVKNHHLVTPEIIRELSTK